MDRDSADGRGRGDEITWEPQLIRARDTAGTSVTRMHMMRNNAEGRSVLVLIKKALNLTRLPTRSATRTYTSVKHFGANYVHISVDPLASNRWSSR